MFNSIDKHRGFLFVTYDLEQSLRSTTETMLKAVENIDENRFLNTAPDDLKKYLVAEHSVTPIILLRDHWYADHLAVQVDVRYDRMRWIDDTSRPVLMPGERFEVRIPFEGEADLFYSRASTSNMNPPRGAIEKNELVLRYEYAADQPRDIRPEIDRTIAEIEQHLGWQSGAIFAHNSNLPRKAEEAIMQRRERLLARSQRAATLGIPIRRRDDAPRTYVVPTVRKQAAPLLPPASNAKFEPEPTWAMEQYEQALKIVQDMALVMERSPDAFRTMNEEALRQHFLVQLNGQFEGKATGETFNMAGKTDILLREGDRNVFIAECKFWKGPKGFNDAIDQLLSYATWRDGKAAILVFNRGTDTSTVLGGIDTGVKSHANYKRELNWRHESGFRYVLHANGDKNREIILTVLAFHVPK